MMTRNLWRAEWLKTRRRPANIGILISMLIITLLFIAIPVGIALANPDEPEHLLQAGIQFPFPNGFMNAVLPLNLVGQIIAVVFVANAIGSEYGRDTWKMILPRQGSRLRFLTTKLVVALFSSVLLIVLMLIAAQIFAWIGALILGVDLTTSNYSYFESQFKGLIGIFAQMFFYGAFTLLVTIILRSTVGGFVVAYLFSQFLGIFALLHRWLALVLPTNHLQNVLAHWVFEEPEIKQQVIDQFERSVAPQVSLAVVTAYVLMFIAAGAYLFHKRDMAGV